jgi:GH15 family glucan-1,4-alpha-glucosidase
MSGPNTFIGSYWVCALKAAAEMASIMGDAASAKEYSERALLAKENYEKSCWKEDYGYYIADVTIHDCKYSYGPGDHLNAILTPF